MLPSKSCKTINDKNFGLTFFDRFKTGTYLVNWFGRGRYRCRFIGRSLVFWFWCLVDQKCWHPGTPKTKKNLPKYSLWMLCDIFEATNKFETGSLFDVFFSRTLNHGFGFCKRKKERKYRTQDWHKKISLIPQISYWLVKTPDWQKMEGQSKKHKNSIWKKPNPAKVAQNSQCGSK